MTTSLNLNDRRGLNSQRILTMRKKAITWMMLDKQLKEKWMILKKNQPTPGKKSVPTVSKNISMMNAAREFTTAA